MKRWKRAYKFIQWIFCLRGIWRTKILLWTQFANARSSCRKNLRMVDSARPLRCKFAIANYNCHVRVSLVYRATHFEIPASPSLLRSQFPQDTLFYSRVHPIPIFGHLLLDSGKLGVGLKFAPWENVFAPSKLSALASQISKISFVQWHKTVLRPRLTFFWDASKTPIVQ